jgi:hypothetical protein
METLPGSPTREPNNVSYDNDPTRPTRDNTVHRGASRLDEPSRERSYTDQVAIRTRASRSRSTAATRAPASATTTPNYVAS